MHRALRLSTAVFVALAAFGSVAADHDGCRLIRGAETPETTDDVDICRQQQWFHQSETKAGNAAQADDFTLPTFDTTEPATSVTGGAGGGYLGSSLYQVSTAHDQAYHPAFTGTFEGDIDNVIVDFYLFPPHHMAMRAGEQPDGDNFAVDVWLYVDGIEIASHAGLSVPLQDAGDAAKKVTFAMADIYTNLAANGLADKGSAYDIEFRIVGTGIGSNGAIWVYDTTEVPSTMIINATPEELDGLPGMPFIFPSA